MYPFFYIYFFGREIALPMYGMMCLLAACAAVGLAVSRVKKYNVTSYDTVYMSLFAIIGAFIGAYILSVIINTIYAIQNWGRFTDAGANTWEIIVAVFSNSGFVFFGGLIGGTIGGIIYMKMYKLNIPVFVDLVVPCIPLAHAIGRVGCFLGGCCYGIETRYGVTFNHSPALPHELHDVKLLPVQLIETDVNLLLVLILLLYERYRENKNNNKYKTGKSLFLYLIMYSVSRFTLEFFRGDKIRGIFFGISTSQIISVILFCVSVFFMAFYGKIRGNRTLS